MVPPGGFPVLSIGRSRCVHPPGRGRSILVRPAAETSKRPAGRKLCLKTLSNGKIGKTGSRPSLPDSRFFDFLGQAAKGSNTERARTFFFLSALEAKTGYTPHHRKKRSRTRMRPSSRRTRRHVPWGFAPHPGAPPTNRGATHARTSALAATVGEAGAEAGAARGQETARAAPPDPGTVGRSQCSLNRLHRGDRLSSHQRGRQQRRQPDRGDRGRRPHPFDARRVCQWGATLRRCPRIPARASFRTSSTTRPIPPTRRRTSPTVNQQSLSDFAYAFGQFMDHDMDLTLDNGASDPIAVPAGDPIGGRERHAAGIRSVADRSGNRDRPRQSGPGHQRRSLRTSICRRSTAPTWRPTTPCGRSRRPDEDQPGRSAASRQHHLFHAASWRRSTPRWAEWRTTGLCPSPRCSSRATAAATKTWS